MSAKDRGPRPRPDPRDVFRAALKAAFSWHQDRTDWTAAADPTGWWADPQILRQIGPSLAGLFAAAEPTVVLGPQSRGALLGALTASALGVGLVELRKEPFPATDSDRWLITRTPPDYRDRNLELGLRRELLPSTARALFVDDWIDTGGQAVAGRKLVDQAGATWCGAAVIVDGLTDRRLRRDLRVRSLFDVHEL